MKARYGIKSVVTKIMIQGLKKSVALLLGFLILMILSSFNPVAEGKETEVLLLHTNNVTGHLFPCPT